MLSVAGLLPELEVKHVGGDHLGVPADPVLLPDDNPNDKS
jgi:hypothetical protein